MKLIHIILLVSIIFSLIQLGNSNGVIVTNGLISHFGFNNNYYDRASTKSGTGSVGFSTDKWGRLNEALNLSGSNYVNLGQSDFQFLENERYKLSIALWVYPTRFSFVVIDHRASFSYNEAGYQLQINNDGQMVFMSSDDTSSDCDNTVFSKQSDCTELSTGSISLNQWGHLAVTKSNATVRFYVNGIFTNQETQKRSKIEYDGSETQRWIGRAYDDDGYDGAFGNGTQEYGKGKIDDLRIYNRAISDSEVTQLYNYVPPHQCQTTEPGSTWCLTCKGNRTSSGSNCVCPAQTYEDNTSVNCLSCHHKCDGCSGSATNCTLCQDTANRTEAGCGCKFGMVDIGVAVCATCSYQCESCSGSITGCLTCNDPTHRSLPGCGCNDGWLDIGVQNCSECDYQCATCSVDINTCATCVDPTNREIGSNCGCKDGWLDLGVENCSECDYQCATCTGYINTCATCVDPTNRELNTNCGCKDGWLDLNQENCFECDYQCATCTGDVNTCATCEDPNNREINTNCGCKIGWLDVGVEACSQCNYKCGSCSGDINTCLTCSDSNRISDSVCECQDGWLDLGVQNCAECDYQCATCTGDVNTCATCVDPTNRELNTNCDCRIGWLDVGVENCSECDYQCESCTGDINTCATCIDPNNRELNTNCGCKDGWLDLNQENCFECDYQCATCTGDVNTCATCEDPDNREISSNCDCKFGWLDVGVEACAQCYYKCGSCSGDINTCLTCSDLTNRIDDSVCDCQDGWFDIGISECQQCEHQCETCSGTPSSCLACSHETRHLDLECGCIKSYFETGEVACQKCDVKCLSCETSSTNCGECKSGIGRTMELPSCGCQEGFYEVEGQLNCEQCLPHCKTCENGQECTSCYLENQEGKDCQIKLTNPLFNIPGSIQPDLLLDCPIQCSNDCYVLEGVTMCNTCSEGNFRSMETPLCGCLEGYFSEPGEIHCQQCLPTCKTCSNNLSCDSCSTEQNRFYNRVSRKCECKRGYRNPTKQGDYVCQRCLLYQGECFTECPKHTIFDQVEQECVEKEIQISTNKNTIYALGVLFIIAQFVLFKFVLPMMMGNKRLNNSIQYEDDAFYENQYNKEMQKQKQIFGDSYSNQEGTSQAGGSSSQDRKSQPDSSDSANISQINSNSIMQIENF